MTKFFSFKQKSKSFNDVAFLIISGGIENVNEFYVNDIFQQPVVTDDDDDNNKKYSNQPNLENQLAK